MKVFELAVLSVTLLPAAAAESHPVLTIRVNDQTRIDRGTLRIATEVAAQVMEDAGITTVWFVCGDSPSDSLGAECAPKTGQPDLFLRVLAAPVAGHQVRASTTGLTLQGKPGELARFAYVYYERAASVAAAGDCPVTRVLGHVMAHEIGHMLGAEHSSAGMMATDWNRQTIRRMREGYLLFRPEEVRTFRANVRSRIAVNR